MADFHRYPLRVEQSRLDGWWFISVDDIPGLQVFGPNYKDLLDQLKVAAVDLFAARGESITDVEIVPIESGEATTGPWVPADKQALQVM